MRPPINESRTAKSFILVGDGEESWSDPSACARELFQGVHQSCIVLQRPLYRDFFLNYSKQRHKASISTIVNNRNAQYLLYCVLYFKSLKRKKSTLVDP